MIDAKGAAMRGVLRKVLVVSGLMACGARNDASKLSQDPVYPANMPIRSECLGLEANRTRTVAVDWDDQAPLRVCMVLQNDGALAFDIRLRGNAPAMRRQAVHVELRNPVGGSSAGVFPLVWNPFNGLYELQLSQGCLVGAPAGCSVPAPLEMRRLFEALPHSEAQWHPELQLTISFLNPANKLQKNTPRFVFGWNAATL